MEVAQETTVGTGFAAAGRSCVMETAGCCWAVACFMGSFPNKGPYYTGAAGAQKGTLFFVCCTVCLRPRPVDK